MSGRGEQEGAAVLEKRGGSEGVWLWKWRDGTVWRDEEREQGEGSGGANNACNFWGRVVRESPVLYDFVYYKAIFMEL